MRRDELVAIQNEAQRRWAEERLFEVDAPTEGTVAVDNLYMASQ